MGVAMSARETLAVHPQARISAGMTMEIAMDSPAVSGQKQANCGTCGRAWFGHVAYCPYCGHRSASAPADARADAPPPVDHHAAAQADHGGPAREGVTQEPAPPGMRWKASWKPVAAVATVLAVVAIPVGERAVTRVFRAPVHAGAPVAAAVVAATAPDRGATASSAQAPTAERIVPRAAREAPTQTPAPAPPVRHRSLCSVANEAAGLCNPN